MHLLILERKEGREKETERNIDGREKCCLVASCMCPDKESNHQTFGVQTTLQPTEPPGQGSCLHFRSKEMRPRKIDRPLVHGEAGARIRGSQLSLQAPSSLSTHSLFIYSSIPQKGAETHERGARSTKTSQRTGCQ